jgi:hypothetical protein
MRMHVQHLQRMVDDLEYSAFETTNSSVEF